MKCGKGSSNSNGASKKYQEVSMNKKQRDLTFKELKNYLEKNKKGKDSMVYAYVVKSVKHDDGKLLQKGCGPNLEGGIITLCTCKHRMRTYLPEEGKGEWVGKWVAGFTGINAVKNKRENYLFYLMQVEKTFDSHMCLWHYLEEKVHSIKSTNKNPLGDVYEPKAHAKDRFNTNSYKCLHKDHCHKDGGERNDIDYKDRGQKGKKTAADNDIDYKDRGKKGEKTAALLVGDPNFSFVWEKPTIFLNDEPYLPEGLCRRNRPYLPFENFLNVLKEE